MKYLANIFMKSFQALGFNIAESGFLSSLPYLARTVCGLVFGSIGDFIRKNNFITVTTTRKLFCIPCEQL